MTVQELYRQARYILEDAGLDSPDFDAGELSAHFFGLDRAGIALYGNRTPPSEAAAAFCRAVKERAARRPLQYLLGQWEFMGLTLQVGEGVLIPREDTVVLVEELAAGLRGVPAPRGLDLCAGTGAVALGLCSLLPDTEALCLELSPTALSFLKRNLDAYPQYHVQVQKADVLLPDTTLRFSHGALDFIASNPPYIEREELSQLQPEVLREPAMALDGGEDGLLFYRAIAEHWVPLLKPGGLLAVEIGETQAEQVCTIFSAHPLENIRVCQDWAGLDRVVLAVHAGAAGV